MLLLQQLSFWGCYVGGALLSSGQSKTLNANALKAA